MACSIIIVLIHLCGTDLYNSTKKQQHHFDILNAFLYDTHQSINHSSELANFAAEKSCGPEKCPVYLKLPWISNVSSKFENQINKAIASCFYAVKPRVVYNTRVMLPSVKKDSVPSADMKLGT